MPAYDHGVLVFGGCGKVGHLIAPFLEVRDAPFRYWSVEPRECTACPWIDHVKADATDLAAVFLAMRQREAVIYSALGDLTNPHSLFDVGVRGLYNVLLVAKELRIPRLVLMSSFSFYDDWASAKLTSEDRPAVCDDPYGVVKVLAEALCAHFARAYSMSIIALRLASPMTEEDAAHVNARNPHATTGKQLARAVVSALTLKGHMGFDPVFICGNRNTEAVNQGRARSLLGWEP